MSFGGTCTSDDDAPCNLYALGDGFVPAVVPTEYNENAAYKMTWQWIEPMRTTTRSASAAASYTIKLTPSDEATLAGTDIAAHQIALPSINGLTRYVVFEYRLHARIGNPPANANKPGVYAVYYENAYQAFLMKLGADDATNYNGHKPLPVGVQTVVDPTLKVTVVSVTSTTATVKIDITP
jgi:hypothetical protein